MKTSAASLLRVLLLLVIPGGQLATAQTAYSFNTVGYVNVTVPQGKFVLLANPLLDDTNSVEHILDVPRGTDVYLWDAAASAYTGIRKLSSGRWTDSTTTILPGQGFFIKIPGTGTTVITFIGEVAEGPLTNRWGTAGRYLLSSMVPQAGGLEADLGFSARAGDRFYFFDTVLQAYRISTRRPSGLWSGTGGQTVDLAQGFIFETSAAGYWARSFQVSPLLRTLDSLMVERDALGPVTVAWPLPGGILQAADVVTGPWADAGGTLVTNSDGIVKWTTQPTGTARFFRLRSP